VAAAAAAAATPPSTANANVPSAASIAAPVSAAATPAPVAAPLPLPLPLPPASAVPRSTDQVAANATTAAATPPPAKGTKRKSVDPIPAPSSSVFHLRSSLRIALICQSNLNRSMEAHWVLQEEGGIRAYSFGAGNKVRLPGETIDTPHVYGFGTAYDKMYKDLERLNRARYTKNGLLQMLDRNRQLKDAPERWQDHYDIYAKDSQRATNGDEVNDRLGEPPKPAHFDLIITFEKRVFDMVSADLDARSHSPYSRNEPTHLLNIDTTDNHAEAAVSAKLCLQLVESIYQYKEQRKKAKLNEEEKKEGEANGEKDADGDGDGDDDGESWEDEIDEIIDEFEQMHGREVSHSLLFY